MPDDAAGHEPTAPPVAVLLAQLPDAVVATTADGDITYVNPAMTELLGYRPADLAGTSLLDLVRPDDAERARALLLRTARNPGSSGSRIPVRHADGSWRHCEVRGRLVTGHEALVLTLRDISERVAFEEDLAHRAFHDSLTNLPNRALLVDRLDKALRAASRSARVVAMLFCDLDDFKSINDSLGHQFGDELLVEVAQRLRECVRPRDTGARLGGDEFAVLLDDLSDPAEAERVAGRVLERLREPFRYAGGELSVSASVGVALGGAGDTADELLGRADTAMYLAKRRGKNRYEVFRAGANRSSVERLRRLAELRRAMERGELLAYYQPTVALETGQIVGVEALLRWDHPELGRLEPDEFVPLAEESGLIVPMGRWILREACNQLQRWRAELGPRAPDEVCVNLSAAQLGREELVAEVAHALDEVELDGGHLTVEITESGLIGDVAVAQRRLGALKRLGVNVAVDDFGTGYSSLAYLQQLPIDTLKIDRAFTRHVDGGAENSALAKAIVRLGRELHLRTVAEGVERHSQVEALRRIHCPLAQGFYFAQPVDGERILQLLADGVGPGL